MSPIDAGSVTDAATSLAQLANSLAKLATPPLNEDGASELDDETLRLADAQLCDDPANYLG